VQKSTIEPAPRLAGEQSKLLARMANLEKQKRMVQLIDPDHLIEGQDRADLDAVTKMTTS
jgi:purine-binding chemotaxis protein CheW